MNFTKYLAEHGERTVARTVDGFPIRGGQMPLLRQDEYDKIQLGLDAKVKVFATADAKQM